MSDKYEPKYLRELVEALEYKPGWEFFLRWHLGEGDQEVLQFQIVSKTTDSFNFEGNRYINHLFLVPPASYNRNNWSAWLFERIVKVETHEAGEFYRVNGVREFAPHHSNGEDPYRLWFVSDWETADKSSGQN